METPPAQTGVLVIRAWRQGDPSSVVMRVTRTVDVSTGDDETGTTTSVEEVLALVRSWLDQIRSPVTNA
jgi:hypothetical protein